MTNFSRWSWLRTISQRVVPANAGTHHPWPKKEKRPLLKCRNESPRRRDERNCAHAGVPACAGTTHGSVTYMKTPYAIALPATGRGELKLRTERFIVSLSQLAASHSSQRTRLSEAPYPSRRGSRSGNGSRPRCEHLQLLR